MGRRYRWPLRRKDWPSTKGDYDILSKYPYEDVAFLSPQEQDIISEDVFDALIGIPRRRYGFKSCLYDAHGNESYERKLLHKCWRMGAFGPYRKFRKDRRRRDWDVDLPDNEDYLYNAYAPRYTQAHRFHRRRSRAQCCHVEVDRGDDYRDFDWLVKRLEQIQPMRASAASPLQTRGLHLQLRSSSVREIQYESSDDEDEGYSHGATPADEKELLPCTTDTPTNVDQEPSPHGQPEEAYGDDSDSEAASEVEEGNGPLWDDGAAIEAFCSEDVYETEEFEEDDSSSASGDIIYECVGDAGSDLDGDSRSYDEEVRNRMEDWLYSEPARNGTNSIPEYPLRSKARDSVSTTTLEVQRARGAGKYLGWLRPSPTQRDVRAGPRGSITATSDQLASNNAVVLRGARELAPVSRNSLNITSDASAISSRDDAPPPLSSVSKAVVKFSNEVILFGRGSKSQASSSSGPLRDHDEQWAVRRSRQAVETDLTEDYSYAGEDHPNLDRLAVVLWKPFKPRHEFSRSTSSLTDVQTLASVDIADKIEQYIPNLSNENYQHLQMKLDNLSSIFGSLGELNPETSEWEAQLKLNELFEETEACLGPEFSSTIRHLAGLEPSGELNEEIPLEEKKRILRHLYGTFKRLKRGWRRAFSFKPLKKLKKRLSTRKSR